MVFCFNTTSVLTYCELWYSNNLYTIQMFKSPACPFTNYMWTFWNLWRYWSSVYWAWICPTNYWQNMGNRFSNDVIDGCLCLKQHLDSRDNYLYLTGCTFWGVHVSFVNWHSIKDECTHLYEKAHHGTYSRIYSTTPVLSTLLRSWHTFYVTAHGFHFLFCLQLPTFFLSSPFPLCSISHPFLQTHLSPLCRFAPPAF